MNSWLLICNSNYFDLRRAFASEDHVTWPVTEEMIKGDIVYFFLTRPYRAILYKGEVVEDNLYHMDASSEGYVLHPLFYKKTQRYVRIEKREVYSQYLLTETDLKRMGIRNFQANTKVSMSIESYINEKRNPLVTEEKRPPKRRMIKHAKRWLIFFLALDLVLCGAWIGVEYILPNVYRLGDKVEETQWSRDDFSEKSVDNDSETDVDAAEMEIFCCTTKILRGDSISAKLRIDSVTLDTDTQDIQWSSENETILHIDGNGVITAKNVGVCNVIAEFKNRTVKKEIQVVEADAHSGVIMALDYQKISLAKGGKEKISVAFGGNLPEHFSATAYYSENLTLRLEWSEAVHNIASLTMEDVLMKAGEGTVTIYVYAQDDPDSILASTKVNMRITE